MSVRCDSARPSKNKFPKMKKRNKTKKQVKKTALKDVQNFVTFSENLPQKFCQKIQKCKEKHAPEDRQDLSDILDVSGGAC